MEKKLIEAVRKFPCLFDKSQQDYKNKIKKEKAWESVATTTGATVEQCRKRWRTLRDSYVKHVTMKHKSWDSAEQNTKWRFMGAMSFLQKHVTPPRTVSNRQCAAPEQQMSFERDPLLFDGEVCNSWSCDTFGVASTSELSVEEGETNKLFRSKKRRKLQEEAHKKFVDLCGSVNDLIASKKESCEKSRNADFLKVLDSYLLNHSEDMQDKLKIQILNLVYQANEI